MPDGYTIQFTGAIDARTEALLEWLRARGYSEQQTEILTRITVNLPVRPALEPNDEGVDVSRWNWPIDWAAVASAGRKFAYIRASMGYPNSGFTGRDDRFESHWMGARAAGLMVGAYHYFVWNLDGAFQADNFVAATQGDWGEMPPVVDVEPREEDTPAVVDRTVSQAMLTAFINRLIVTTGRGPVIYTSRSAWARMTLEPDWIRNYLLFLADYDDPINLPTHAAFAWMRQYKVAEPGELPWFPGRLDLDRYLGDNPPVPPLFVVKILAAALNVRGGPGTSFPVVSQVMKDDTVPVYEVNAANGWYHIHTTEQQWISGNAAYSVRL